MQQSPDPRDPLVVMVTCLTVMRGREVLPNDEHSQAREWPTRPVSAEALLNPVHATLGCSFAHDPTTVPEAPGRADTQQYLE